MRAETNADKVRRLMIELGRAATGPGRVYFTGGTSAVLVGWRASTVDVDLKFDPEPPEVFAALARLKNELDLNIELAAPDQFIPELPGWHSRSQFIGVEGKVEFFHYDFYAQALAKIERGHARDLSDVRQMLERGLIEQEKLRELFEQLLPKLERYPALDERAFRKKLEEFLEAAERAVE